MNDPTAIPPAIQAAAATADWLAVSGSRNPSAVSLDACGSLLLSVAARATVFLGDYPEGADLRPGIDQIARRALLRRRTDQIPNLAVLHAADMTAAALVARSQALALAVAAHRPHGQRGLLLAFPDRPPPPNLRPSPRWLSGQPTSGTWSTVSLAIGRGARALVYLPPWGDGNADQLERTWDMAPVDASNWWASGGTLETI